MILQDRDYQTFGVKSFGHWVSNNMGNGLLLYPTGVGKSVILGRAIAMVHHAKPSTRSLILTHSKHLVKQDYDKLKEVWPSAAVGIYCDGLKRKEHYYPITIGTIQSMWNLAQLFGHIDHFFIDEAHLVSPKDKTMYRKFIAGLRAINPKMTITGLTATGWRNGQGWLWEGDDALFDGPIVDSCSTEALNWYFDQGYLIKPVPRETKTQYDTTGLKTVEGEYNQAEAEARVNTQTLNERVVAETWKGFQSRNKGMVFAQGIKHVVALHNLFTELGAKVCSVHSKMSSDDVDATVAMFKGGEYELIINNGILTTGFDDPHVDYIGINRVMKTSSLWVQIIGRGTRPWYMPGYDLSTREGRLASIAASPKQDLLVADFGENVRKCGFFNDPIIPRPKGEKKPGDMPIRVCDNCGTYNPASAVKCSYCGEEFPRIIKMMDKASKRKLVKENKVPDLPPPPDLHWFDVDRVIYDGYYKRTNSLRATYQTTSLRSFTNYMFPEGNPGQRKAFCNMWLARHPAPDVMDIPLSLAETLKRTGDLKVPKRILVDLATKHHEIRDYEY